MRRNCRQLQKRDGVPEWFFLLVSHWQLEKPSKVGVVSRRFTDNYNQTSSPLMRCAHKESLYIAEEIWIANVSGEIGTQKLMHLFLSFDMKAKRKLNHYKRRIWDRYSLRIFKRSHCRNVLKFGSKFESEGFISG